MSDNIFQVTAPAYWEKGLPVIPLTPRDKSCFLYGWSEHCYRMPTDKEQNFWLRKHANGNIGLPLGPCSRVVVIDIDTTDKKLINIIEGVIPKSPWRRIGQKGYCAAFRYNGEKSFQINTAMSKDENGINVAGQTIVECLSAGKQMVLPPSIHPKTLQPYEANCNLIDVVDTLPILPVGVEDLLRTALMEEADLQLSATGGVQLTKYVSVGERDVTMTKIAGALAYGITRGELTVKEALDKMVVWHSLCQEKVAGDDVSIDKGINKLVEFLTKDVLGPKNKPLPLGWDEGLTDKEKSDLNLTFSEESQEWDYAISINYLMNVFKSYPTRTDPKRMEAINHVLLRISRSPTLSQLDQERILKWINDSNKDLSIAALRKQINSLKSGNLMGNDHAELARAVLADFGRYGKVAYSKLKFWQYAGSHWEEMDENFIYRHIAEEYGNLPAAKKRSDHKGIMNVLSSLLPQELGVADYRGINFANGFLLIDEARGTMELVDHDDKYGMTYTLPFCYNPDLKDKKPRFDQFLKDIWSKDEDYEEKVRLLQQLMGITVCGMGPSFERAVLLFGLPHSGKTQLLRIVESFIPEGTWTCIEPYSFDDKFSVSKLSESLLNSCGELRNDKDIDGAKFKSIVSGERISGQYKFGQLFDFSPKCTHWFASNHLCKTKDSSDGFNRRWAILTFNNQVSSKDKIRDIGRLIVSEEREAIVAWVIDGMRDLIKKNDVDLPASHHMAMKEMISSNDTVFFWLEAGGVKVDPNLPTPLQSRSTMYIERDMKSLPKNNSTPVKLLHENYWNSTIGVGSARPVPLRTFASRLREICALKGTKMAVPPSGDITQSVLVGFSLIKTKTTTI